MYVPKAKSLVAAAGAKSLVFGRPCAAVDVALVAEKLLVELQGNCH